MASRFVPSDWELTDKLRQFARDKGLTEKNIDEQEEKFRDHQYKRSMHRWDACWRNWIKLGIDKQWIILPQKTRYRRPESVSEAQLERDREDWARDMRERFGK